MAVLEDIRKKGGIIISIVIGLALFAFVLGDFIPGSRGTRNFDVAKVGGQTLSVQTLEAKIEEVTNLYRQQIDNIDDRMRDMIHDNAWQMLTNETIMQQTYEKIGLTVSPEELMDWITGSNPPPFIRQYFFNQNGEFERSRLLNYLKSKDMDPNAAYEWSLIEKSLLQDRYTQKYNALVGKGVFVPDFLAENENQEINKKVDFDYIIQRYTSIHDSVVHVSKDDLKAYYKKHQRQWEQNASRDIEYVMFNIVPSDDDHAAAQAWIEKIKPEFEEAADPFLFIRLNARVSADTRFMTREQLPVQAADLFDEPEGAMAGPFQEGDSWKLVRLAKAENRPDSVKVRQIVVLPQEQTQAAYSQAATLADSIKTAIEQGANFMQLAVKYSADPNVAMNNGDIGWIYDSDVQAGSMMENLFSMKTGEVIRMENQQALFVVQVTERGKEVKKVQIATLQHNIIPSTRTEQIIYSQASKFAIENRNEKQFDETSSAQNLNKRMASYLGENDRQIPGLTSARQIVRWAYNAKAGQVSDVFNIDNSSYVVAILKTIRKEGFAPINQVVTEMDFAIRREKKAALIVEQLSNATKSAQSFSDLAVNLNLLVEKANAITFSSFSIPSAGIEPALIASVTNADEGKISHPVEGSNGVFLFTVTQIEEPEEFGMEQARERLIITYSNRSMSESSQALRKAANIKDMRSKFY